MLLTLLARRRYKGSGWWLHSTMRVMKLTAMLFVIFTVHVQATVYSQTVTYQGKHVSLKSVFTAIEEQTGYVFFYTGDVLENTRPVNVSVKNAEVTAVLKQVLKGQNLNYFIENKTVVIKKDNTPPLQPVKIAVPPVAEVLPDYIVTGRVTNSTTGEPLAGVSIREENGLASAQTDNSGNFKLSIPAGKTAILVFSYVGFNNYRVTVREGKELTVQLEASDSKMNDVVVIGYGTSTRRDLTASVSSVSSRDLKDIPINSAQQALAGRLAGVQVTGAEGSPDAQVSIRVRGGGSITQDNSPLYVVDGIILDNALSILSPQDIESIDVLKDASATAIYGARGANGVVVITTKGGKKGKTILTYNGFAGVQKVGKKLDVMDPYNFVLYQYERTRGNLVNEEDFANRYGTFQDFQKYRDVPAVSWQDAVFGRSAFMQTHNVALSGGSDKTQYALSLTKNITEAVMQNSDFDRNLVNFRLNQAVSDKFKAGINFRFNGQKVNGAGTSNPGSNHNSFLRQAIRYTPYLQDGQAMDYYDAELVDETRSAFMYIVNPLLLIRSQYKKQFQTAMGISGFADYSFTKWLSFRTTLGYNYQSNLLNVYDDTLTSNSKQWGNNMPIATVANSYTHSINNSNVLSFSNAQLGGRFHEKNKLNVIVGQEIYEIRSKSHTITQRFFPVGTTPEKALANLSLASPPAGFVQPVPQSSEGITKIASFFSRLNYTYNDKYLVSLSIRADGSTVFAPGRQWSYFPAGSFAWRVSKEKFMEKLDPVVSDLKLRLSYGEAGNNRIPPFLYLSQFVTYGYYSLNEQMVTTYHSDALANSLLQWESMVTSNVGIDLGLFNNRITLNADYYINKSNNLLVQIPVPSTSGYTSQFQNVGSTSNRGLEFQVNANIIDRKDFSYSANFNISFNKNKVESLGRQDLFLLNSGVSASDDFLVRVGESVGTMYGFINDGMYSTADFDYNETTKVYTLKAGVASNQAITGTAPQPGSVKHKDLNADGAVDYANDRTIIGDANPKFIGGLNQMITWKNWDASVFVNFVYGNKILNYNKAEFTSGYSAYSNLLSMAEGRYTTINAQGQVVTDPKELDALNANATFWRPLTASALSNAQTWAVEDGSFLRVNNITIGYTLPRNILNAIKIQKFRVYATVNNLAILTNYTGYDPEVNTRRSTPMTPGVDYSAYPRSKAYILGLNITF